LIDDGDLVETDVQRTGMQFGEYRDPAAA